MTANERLMKIATASPAKLARIDAVLNDCDDARPEVETRTESITSAGRLLGLSRNSIYKLIREGSLKVVLLNGTRRVTRASINAYVQGGAQ